MKIKVASNASLLLSEENEVDLSRASYAPKLSSASLDFDSQTFHITLDRILFSSPSELVTKILDAHDYALNLENILACIDDMVLGVSVPDDAKATKPKSYLPQLQFRLPQKAHIGPLLSKFYSEIKHYETSLAEFNGGPLKKNNQEIKEANAKINALEEEVSKLKSENTLLHNQLNSAKKSEASANHALATQNILPPNIRIATVKEINLVDRSIILKSGRTTINLPIILCSILPQKDDKCLVHIHEGNTLGCFFFDYRGTSLLPRLATVMMVRDSFCKIRDEDRNTWQIQAKNSAEMDFFNKIKKGDSILLYVLEDQPLRFEELSKTNDVSFTDHVQEAFARHHIASTNVSGTLNSQVDNNTDVNAPARD